MVVLSDERRDAVTELLNIGFGRAAASLSALTNARVELLVPLHDDAGQPAGFAGAISAGPFAPSATRGRLVAAIWALTLQ